ncbi:DnaJ domain-containing protein [Aquamicrobium sp. LC103]|uniref:DnaJ domain-containing protein n=1 Tax=Aquamicrobium sp. LC103 TaxID=1120658 RepID=UPI00063E738B|nr:DnaJ domain-containing protein [Aquamicrobium sp. LC103]TKT76947.1 molecular chaperone DnaJ [Aquamicrobium sp. LC103]
MTVMFYLSAALLIVALVGALFIRADASRLAAGLRLSGPLILGIVGVGLLFLGRAGIGGMLISGAVAWYTSNRFRSGGKPSPGRHSTVRTAALEMELDHDTGALEGLVLAGGFEGRELGSMSLTELLSLASDLSSDGESLQLLETYLDGRFPLWREDAQMNAGGGQARAPASGPMTKQEAYEILGLETGASTAEIRKAHRRLMQRLHPDLGGTSFLAARINEAKDVLLSDHD